MTIQVGDPRALADFQFDFTDQIPIGVNIEPGGIVHATSDSRVVIVSENTDVTLKRSTVRINQSALPHGAIYLVTAIATLTNGEQIPGSMTRRVFGGASA